MLRYGIEKFILGFCVRGDTIYYDTGITVWYCVCVCAMCVMCVCVCVCVCAGVLIMSFTQELAVRFCTGPSTYKVVQ